MNHLLELKGSFTQESRKPTFGPPELPAGAILNSSHLVSLRDDLISIRLFFQSERLFSGALVSAYYNKVAAKSNRISALLSRGKKTANSTIVGARFTNSLPPKHIITHYVSPDTLDETLKRLNIAIIILDKHFGGSISHPIAKALTTHNINFQSYSTSKSVFSQILVDAFYLEKFDVLTDLDEFNTNAIITIYETEVATIDLLKKLGISIPGTSIMDKTTILLQPDDLRLLKQKAPYLVSMALSDLSDLTPDDFTFETDSAISIAPPKNEPIVGVIDSLFDTSVYFSDWVEFHDCVANEIPKAPADYVHGTAVSSIIVDGATINPTMDDGCGRFRVRHFGVATGGRFSSFSILRQIDEIILKNRDIKVWNLSLGSHLEINPNFISPEAAILDRIQAEYDVIFVVAGTNKPRGVSAPMKIGAPADSINALVVNSVTKQDTPTEYTRHGPVLSFFTKPDISYYGGDGYNPIRVCTPTGEGFMTGTSFAAPWISRKMAYLIHILGLSRELAKGLIIHSATGWDKQTFSPNLVGHGIVPMHIKNIIQCADNEIQFMISNTSEAYNTYTYNIPVPINKEKHPYIAKATLCYFPYCARNQGVDYTNTELDISFGRIKDSKIDTINNNYQTTDDVHHVLEEDARLLYRKWDNIKHIREVDTQNNRDKKVYPNGLWGISVKTKERLDAKYGEGIRFGVIITLREIHGVNRIDDFIKQCYVNRWLVNTIDVHASLDIYNVAEEFISFDD